MNENEFNEALLRLGANLDRWPEAERETAKRLIAASPAAERMLADFSAFERSVADAVRPAPFGAAEIGAILAAIDAEEETWRPSRTFWLAGAGASAISFVAGFVIVLTAFSPDGGLGLPVSIIGLALGDGDVGGLL